MRRAAAILAALALAAGCSFTRVTEGPPLPDATAQLVVGRTSKAEALALLGPPVSVRRQLDGDLFIYASRQVRLRSLLLVPLLPVYARTWGETTEDQVTLLFDAGGVLAGVGERRGR